MKKMLILFMVCFQLNQLNAQETKVEIYDVSSNTLITGIVTDSIGDTIFVLTDQQEILAFAKSGMQGLNYGVSNEIKKLQRALIRAETSLHFRDIPGKYQIKKGEFTKGKILKLITYTGMGCFVTGGTGAIIGLPLMLFAAIGGAYDMAKIGGTVFLGSLYVFVAGMIIMGVAALWTHIEFTKDVVNKVKNRYYYSGEILIGTKQVKLPAD